MDNDSDETSTSLENTENFDNPRRDILAEGFLRLLKPVVDDLEEKVKGTRLQQHELNLQLDAALAECYKLISAPDKDAEEIELCAKKLNDIRQRVSVVFSVLQNSQDKLAVLRNKIEAKNRQLQQ